MSIYISVVIPVYCSESSIDLLLYELDVVFKQMDCSYEIILIDDNSPDNSWRKLKELKQQYGAVLKIAKLLKNSGQHNAILCGFYLSKGQLVITMDDDLQNPPAEIPKLVAAIEQGYDLVIGSYEVKQHSTTRNLSGSIIDGLQRKMFNLPRTFQLTSFRAIKRIVIDNVCQMGGVFPYITSMLFSHTTRYVNVLVQHDSRKFGQSNYNLKRSFILAANLIINYSSYPLYFVAFLCLLAFGFSICYGMYILFFSLIYGVSIPGWTSLIVLISFFNALILLCLLIFGIYISRLSQQITRSRVSYTIEEMHE